MPDKNRRRYPGRRVTAGIDRKPKNSPLLKALLIAAPVTFTQVPDFQYKQDVVRYEKGPMYVTSKGKADATPRHFEGRLLSGITIPAVKKSDPQLQPETRRSGVFRTKAEEITVHFALNSAALTASGRKILDAGKDLFQRADHIEITGYTCRLGSKAFNRRLAGQRANAVRKYLTSNLIDKGRITNVTGLGGCCYVSLSNHKANRRAVVKVTLREEITKADEKGGDFDGHS